LPSEWRHFSQLISHAGSVYRRLFDLRKAFLGRWHSHAVMLAEGKHACNGTAPAPFVKLALRQDGVGLD